MEFYGGAAAFLTPALADPSAWGAAPAAADFPPPLAHAGSSGDAALGAPGGDGAGQVDVRVAVECGGLLGIMLLPRGRVLIYPGTDAAREVTPTEFEKLGGKGAAKKWRSSIRLKDGEHMRGGDRVRAALGCARLACLGTGSRRRRRRAARM